jgi:hypothetical protein
MIDTDTPANLKAGTVIVRVSRAGEVLDSPEEWTVEKWVRPTVPRAGESWSSGFLLCHNKDGQTRMFGPAKLIKTDFRREGKWASRDDDAEKPKPKINPLLTGQFRRDWED